MNKKIIIVFFVVSLFVLTSFTATGVRLTKTEETKNENKNEKECINPGAPQKTVMGGKLTPPWGWWGHYHKRTVDDGGSLWLDYGTEEGDEYEVDIYAHQTNGAGHIWPFPSHLEVTQRASNVEKWTIPATGPYTFKFDLECSGDYDLFSQYQELEIFIYYSLAGTETFVYFKVEDIDQNDLWSYEKKVCNDIAVNGQVYSDDYSAHETKRSDTLNLNKGDEIWISGGIKVISYTEGTIPGRVEGNHNSKLNYVEIDWPNDPPNKPTISGPSSGHYSDNPFSFEIKAIDPEDDDVYYYVDWGDGSNTGWLGKYGSGYQKSLSHSFPNSGGSTEFKVKAKAKDVHGEDSGWTYHYFTLPRNRATNRPFPNFLESHPMRFQLLQRFLKL